jgi:hypothetical protein
MPTVQKIISGQQWLNHQSVGVFGIIMILVAMLISADAWMSIGMMVLTGECSI